MRRKNTHHNATELVGIFKYFFSIFPEIYLKTEKKL